MTEHITARHLTRGFTVSGKLKRPMANWTMVVFDPETARVGYEQ
jgi:hypothetical protein